MLNLARKHGNERLESACQRAIEVGVFNSGFVKQLLKNNVEQPSTKPLLPAIKHENLRGESHYRGVAQAC